MVPQRLQRQVRLEFVGVFMADYYDSLGQWRHGSMGERRRVYEMEHVYSPTANYKSSSVLQSAYVLFARDVF